MRHATIATATGLAALWLGAGDIRAQELEFFDLGEIVVTPSAVDLVRSRTGAAVTTITRDELDRLGDLTLADYLERLPGITLQRSGPPGSFGDIRVRGFEGRYVSVYIDGILVTDPSAPSGQFDDFTGLTTGGIRRIEILKGAQSALYGGTAVGGVISIETLGAPEGTEGITQSLGLEVGSYDTLAASYRFSRTEGPATLSFSAATVTSAGFSAADENAGNTEADGYDRTRLTAGVEYRAENGLTFGVNGFAERGSVEFDDIQGVPPFAPFDGTIDDEGTRQTLGLRAWARAEAGIWTHDLAATGYFVEREQTFDGTSTRFRSRRLALEYRAQAPIRPDLTVVVGGDHRDERAEYTNLPGGDASTTTTGVFAEALWSPSSDLDLTATLRLDRHSEFGSFTTGRVAAAWRASERTVVRAAFGTGYRAPSIDELFGDYTAGSFPFIGNPDLEPEESVSAEIGIDHEFANGGRISLTAFEGRIDNLITFVFGSPSTVENVAGVSTRRGVEVAGSLPLGDSASLFGAATFLQAEDSGGQPLPRTPERDLTMGVEAGIGADWTATLVGRNFAGAPDVDDFTVLDAQIARAIGGGAEVYLRIENLLDAQYQLVPGYGTSDRAFYAGIRATF